MENKTAPAILARYFTGRLPDNNYREIILAMHKHASLQCAEMKEERDKLQKFKEYVHDRLDKMGIPVDPESPHKEAGCRIGGRLDVVVAMLEDLDRLSHDEFEWSKLQEENERLKKKINAVIDAVDKSNDEKKQLQEEVRRFKSELRMVYDRERKTYHPSMISPYPFPDFEQWRKEIR